MNGVISATYTSHNAKHHLTQMAYMLICSHCCCVESADCGFASVDKAVTSLVRVCGDHGSKLRTLQDRVAVVQVIATVASRLSGVDGCHGNRVERGAWERLLLSMYTVVRDACRGSLGRQVVCAAYRRVHSCE